MKDDSTAMRPHRACWKGTPSDRSLPAVSECGTSECAPTFVLRLCSNNIAVAWAKKPNEQ